MERNIASEKQKIKDIPESPPVDNDETCRNDMIPGLFFPGKEILKKSIEHKYTIIFSFHFSSERLFF